MGGEGGWQPAGHPSSLPPRREAETDAEEAATGFKRPLGRDTVSGDHFILHDNIPRDP